jgi:hypothetical protein
MFGVEYCIRDIKIQCGLAMFSRPPWLFCRLILFRLSTSGGIRAHTSFLPPGADRLGAARLFHIQPRTRVSRAADVVSRRWLRLVGARALPRVQYRARIWHGLDRIAAIGSADIVAHIDARHVGVAYQVCQSDQ